jgi:hypothetical protein
MMTETLDFLGLIEDNSENATGILKRAIFTKRKATQFEHFLQLFCSAFNSRHSSDKDFIALKKFIAGLSEVETTIASRVELFVLCSAMLKQFPHRKPPLENTLLKKLGDNRGCLEYDLRQSNHNYSTTSSTLLGFVPKYPSSRVLPSQFNEKNTIETFKSQVRVTLPQTFIQF